MRSLGRRPSINGVIKIGEHNLSSGNIKNQNQDLLLGKVASTKNSAEYNSI